MNLVGRKIFCPRYTRRLLIIPGCKKYPKFCGISDVEVIFHLGHFFWYTLYMPLLRIIWWAIIFLTRIRFPPGVSIADILYMLISFELLGPVVQSSISANPAGLNINPLFSFMYFNMAVCFKTFDKETSVHPENISRKTYSILWTNSRKIWFKV